MKTGQTYHRVVLVLRDLFLLATFLFIHGFVVFPVTARAGTPLIQVSQYTGGSIKQPARAIKPVEWRVLFIIISGQVQFTARLLLFRNDPDGVNKTWNITTKS